MSCQEVSNDGKGENKKKKFRDIEEMQRHAANGPVTRLASLLDLMIISSGLSIYERSVGQLPGRPPLRREKKSQLVSERLR